MYYRILLPVLCASLAAGAPQSSGDSDVTFVKIQPQPLIEDAAPSAPTRRESRIENLPLTIPGTITSDSNVPTDSNLATDKLTAAPTDSSLTVPLLPENSQSKESIDKVENLPVSTLVDSASDSLETAQSRQGKRIESDETTESFEIATEKYEELTEKPANKNRKFVSKLGFVKKTYNRYSSNSIDKTGLRRFKSNCRCEKIWNCPKLQISVPRCPDEYFLCCF